MKKKKIIIPVAIIVLLVSIITINVEKANAGTGMCTFKETYYFAIGVNPDRTGTITSRDNTFFAEKDGMVNSSFNVREGTVEDCVNYVNTVNKVSSGSSGCKVDETDGSATCGSDHVNSGSQETGRTSVSEIVDTINGMGVTAGCEALVNGAIKMDSTEVKDNGKDSASGKNKTEISRVFDPSTGEIFQLPSGGIKIGFQVIDNVGVAPCETDDEDPEEEKKECTCSPGGGGGGGGSMNTCGGTHTNSIEQSDCGEFAGTPQSQTCTANPTIRWSVSVTTTEVITVSVNVIPQTIYAGGGVGININHSSSTSSSISSICVETTERIPKCNVGTITSKYGADGKISGFDCIETKKVWDEDEEEWVDEEINHGPATCVATSPNAVDQAEAESRAKAAAASLGGGGSSPQPIHIHARQSNDEKDNTMYDLSNNVAEQGVAVSTSSSDISVATGSMGTGNGMNTSINLACINRKTGKVRYVTGSSCTEDEVEGGNKYYIPLKDPDETFNFRITSGNISTMTTTTLDGMCGVTVKQKLYDKTTGKYKFVYRPVDLLTDPQTTVFPGRSPASNWVILKNTENASRTGQYDLLMKRDKVEYSAKLDTANIINIKNINENNKNYATFNTINNSGKSTILDSLGVTRSSNTAYNKLGECNRKSFTSIDGVSSDNSDSIADGTECW